MLFKQFLKHVFSILQQSSPLFWSHLFYQSFTFCIGSLYILWTIRGRKGYRVWDSLAWRLLYCSVGRAAECQLTEVPGWQEKLRKFYGKGESASIFTHRISLYITHSAKLTTYNKSLFHNSWGKNRILCLRQKVLISFHSQNK